MSILDVLLSDNPQAEGDRPSGEWAWARKGVKIPCKGLFTDELRELRKKCTKLDFNPKTHEREDVFDIDKFHDLLIIACTGDLFTAKEVRDHYGVVEATDALRKAMRHPADYGGLRDFCQGLCGAGGPTPEVEVKNG